MAAVATRLELRILGPLEVVVAGSQVALGGARQQALLALLALERGTPVSAERIADELWEGAPPPGAAKTLQVYISRLRAVVGDGAIVRRGNGYAIAVDDTALDAARFEQLLVEGRKLLGRGKAHEARASLVEALALWRGEALAGFEYAGWAEIERRRLGELRMQALEERIDADLALGGSESLAAEVEALVAAHPLRERLRAQLMLALYRVGRQGDALAAFQAGRHELLDGLGVEPGPALHDLQRRILGHDPELGATGRLPLRVRRGRRPPAAAVLFGACAIAAVGVAVVKTGHHHGVGGLAVARVDAQGSVRAAGRVTSPATDLAVGGGKVWALSGDAGTITSSRATDASSPRSRSA
jgi:DNA-binding SARP family transcriptional activator